MPQNDKIQLFEDKRIRTAWDEEKEEWYFSIVDVVAVLTDQPDQRHAAKYWSVLKTRLKKEGSELNEARFSNIFIEKRASSCPQSLEKSRLFSYPLLMSEGENSQNVKRIFLRKVVI